MKKYMIVALLPILFQSALYGADLNNMIRTELENARGLVNRNTVLELDPVLHALVHYAKKSDSNSVKAINKIKDIKNALLQYRSEQYTSNWYNICSYFKSNPEIVTNEIDPAIKKVNATLKTLQSNASIYGYVKAAALVAFVVLIGTAIYVKREDIKEVGNQLREDYNSGELRKQVGQAANTAGSYAQGHYRELRGQNTTVATAVRAAQGDEFSQARIKKQVGQRQLNALSSALGLDS